MSAILAGCLAKMRQCADGDAAGKKEAPLGKAHRIPGAPQVIYLETSENTLKILHICTAPAPSGKRLCADLQRVSHHLRSHHTQSTSTSSPATSAC